ncbi:hypothetical protein DL764_002505 [Monosporascus ibericus]|uniref:SET domain-containing protein n=1 Tax=Monosporascus ibericus TaxID=155417 RepID=A0A4Q4TLB4_9PEZI|nr:hypothetical protein DL764_002505 [Monosporascus ibericus]
MKSHQPRPEHPNPRKRKDPPSTLTTTRRDREKRAKKGDYERDSTEALTGGKSLRQFYGVPEHKRGRGTILNDKLRVRVSRGKGYGVFTSKAGIVAGESLLSEEAILDLPRLDKKTSLRVVQRLVTQNKHAELGEFMSLTISRTGQDTEHERIRNNAFRIDSTKTGRHIVFFGISHANHRCRPNARMIIHDSGWAELKALEDLPRIGTEVTNDYLGLDDWGYSTMPRVAEVQAATEDGWGFGCACAACLDAKTTDTVREHIETMQKSMGFTRATWPGTATELRQMDECFAQYTSDLQSQGWWNMLQDVTGYAKKVYEKNYEEGLTCQQYSNMTLAAHYHSRACDRLRD